MGKVDGALLDNETVMKILDDSVINNAILVDTLDGSNPGYIDIKHLHKVQSMNGDVPQMTINYTDWLRHRPSSGTSSGTSSGPSGLPLYDTVMGNITNYPLAYQDPVTMRWYSVDSNGNPYWLNGGLRRRKFRSHKKHHVKSRSRRSRRPRSKKSCSRRR